MLAFTLPEATSAVVFLVGPSRNGLQQLSEASRLRQVAMVSGETVGFGSGSVGTSALVNLSQVSSGILLRLP